VLPGLAERRFLVTSGYLGFQEGKVRALGIATLFERIYVDAVDGLERHRGKKNLFRAILDELALEPSAALVVGDSERSEIAAGRALAMPTVQILRHGVSPAQTADWRISTLHELPTLIAKINARSG
jgi:FMN phosphatase YigB (HAD superfamily)